MRIEHFEFDCPDDGHCIFGINISEQDGTSCVNLFNLDENKKGAKIAKNLWKLSQHVLDTFLPGRTNKSDINWTLTSGFRTTDIKFKEKNGKPLSLSFSDIHTVVEEEFGIPFSIDRYSKEYSNIRGTPVHESDHSPQRERVMPKKAADVFVIPCPQAKDGVFYCKPEFHEGFIEDQYESVLVDTKKLINRILQDDPKMYEHARYKFANTKVEDYLENNSFRSPFNTGSLATTPKGIDRNRNSLDITSPIYKNTPYSPAMPLHEDMNSHPDLKVTLCSGNAGMLILAEQLNLPFIAISVNKAWGPHVIEAVKKEIGYGYTKSESSEMHYKLN